MKKEHKSLAQIYVEFKENNKDPELKKICDMIDSIAESPSGKKSDYLELQVANNSERIAQLPLAEQKMLENYINQSLFIGTKADSSNITKWEFFTNYATKNKWSPVLNAIEIINHNEEVNQDQLTRSEQPTIKEQENLINKNRKDLEVLEKLNEETIIPWTEDIGLSEYNKNWIQNNISSKRRLIENRIERSKVSDFGLWLKTTRKERGLTLREFAEKAQISYSYVNRIESGQRKMPSLPVIDKLAGALDIHKDILKNIIFGNELEGDTLIDIVERGNYLVGAKQPTPEFKENMSKLLNTMLKNRIEIDDMADIFNMVKRINDSVYEEE